jgi:hypothetical protein
MPALDDILEQYGHVLTAFYTSAVAASALYHYFQRYHEKFENLMPAVLLELYTRERCSLSRMVTTIRAHCSI